MKTNSQSGFAVILIILIVAVAGGVSSLGYLQVKSAQENKKNLAAQSASDLSVAKAKKASEIADAEKAAKAQAIEKAAAEKAQSANAAAPTVAPSPKAATTPASTVTPFTTAGCNKTVTVYVSNKSGTAGSYTPPENWHAEKTLAYGAAVSGECYYHSSMGGYVSINDLWLKVSDLSSSKP